MFNIYMTKIEMIERNQEQAANKHKIMDQYVLAKEAEAKAAQDAKSAKVIAWVSLWTSIVGTIAALIALFK